MSVLFVLCVCVWGHVSLDTLMGSQTACSGPLEINGIPAPNSCYQGASDPYLVCGKCSQSHFILVDTHTHTQTDTTLPVCTCKHECTHRLSAKPICEDILTLTNKQIQASGACLCVVNKKERFNQSMSIEVLRRDHHCCELARR